MSRVKAVILAAGLGTRLKPLTDRMPKCLAPIAGRPILDYWLDLLGDLGVLDVLINTHTFPEQMRAYITRRNEGGCRRLIEAHEPELLGSAGTIANNGAYADDAEEIILIYADNLSDVDLGAMLEFHRSHDDPMTMLLFRALNPKACGIAELDEESRVVSFVEKPEAPKGDLANAGVYVLDAAAYREIAALNAFDIGFDVLPKFVGRMRGWRWDGYHRDIGTSDAYRRAQTDALPLLTARGVDEEGRQPAVFLDRDGTLIEQVHYLSDPAQVRILPGVPEALRRLRFAGYRSIVVSNQSAVGRGLIDQAQLDAINAAMCEALAHDGAVIDAIYTCPVVPESDDRTIIEHPDRKPGPGMLERAAADHHLSLSRSWMIGDMISDVLAGHHAGCRGSILVETGKADSSGLSGGEGRFERARDIEDAADMVIRNRPEQSRRVEPNQPRSAETTMRQEKG